MDCSELVLKKPNGNLLGDRCGAGALEMGLHVHNSTASEGPGVKLHGLKKNDELWTTANVRRWSTEWVSQYGISHVLLSC